MPNNAPHNALRRIVSGRIASGDAVAIVAVESVTRYAIQASVTLDGPDGSSRTRQVPTFYLDSRIQGIVSEAHAETIAREVVDPFGLASRVALSIVATTAEERS